MVRHKINSNAICSSENYRQSKKLHMDMLERNHKVFTEMVIKGEIIIKKQAYIKVFGNLIAITPSEVARFEKEVSILVMLDDALVLEKQRLY